MDTIIDGWPKLPYKTTSPMIDTVNSISLPIEGTGCATIGHTTSMWTVPVWMDTKAGINISSVTGALIVFVYDRPMANCL